VKVDREERPDVDEIYMKAVQAMTGSGGWPMSVFLTPTLEPFYGGTYFPAARHVRPAGFAEVLGALAKAWKDDRQRLVERAACSRSTSATKRASTGAAAIDPAVLDASLAALEQNFDPVWGGFGDAPKFPHALDCALSCGIGSAPATRRRSRSRRPACCAWPRAACTTSSAAVSTATASTSVVDPALREDAVRQCAARAGLPRRVPRDR
jgi:uncharacterized protein YyaL (SSP411 family)